MVGSDPQTVLVDYRSQIIDNCEFLTTRDEFINIITAKEPIGKIRAIALSTNKNSKKRKSLIASEPLDTVQKAIASLHEKSSEAVHLYIMTNGYAEPRVLDDDDDHASVVSSDRASSTNAPSVWSATSDTTAEVIVPVQTESSFFQGSRPAPYSAAKKGKAANSQKACKMPTAAAARKPHDTYDGEKDEDDARSRVRQMVPPSIGVAGRHTPRQPPPPRSSWGRPDTPPLTQPQFQISAAAKPVNGSGFISQPGPLPLPIGAHPQYVCITIDWVHHSSACILGTVHPSLRALKTAAISYVCSNLGAFKNVMDNDKAILKSFAPGSRALQATVKSVWVGEESWDFTSSQNDLSGLLALLSQQHAIPKFGVKADYIRPCT